MTRRLSPSQLKVWHNCPQEWHYSYVEGFKPRRNQRVFEKGLYMHEKFHVMFQTLQATGHKPGDDFILNFMMNHIQKDLVTEDNIEIMSVVWPLMSKYISLVSPEIDTHMEVLGVELDLHQVWEDIEFHCIIDLAYRDLRTGKIRIRDHKTSEKKNAWTQKKLMMDNQLFHNAVTASLYFGEPVYDVEINFVNTFAYSPNSKVKPSARDLFQLFRHEHNKSAIDAYKANLRLVNKKMDDPPIRNYTAACTSCRYFDLCHFGGRGIDMSEVIESNYKPKETPVAIDNTVTML
jgi:hypothetical protein